VTIDGRYTLVNRRCQRCNGTGRKSGYEPPIQTRDLVNVKKGKPA
jgi:hypothetical protein